MAIHVNSTPVPTCPSLGSAAALSRLLAPYPGASMQAQPLRSHRGSRGATPRQSELLAILDAGPIAPADLAHLSRQRRRRAEDGIAALIDLLDALEPDPDLEDGGDDEPSLGSPEVDFSGLTGRIVRGAHIDQRHWADGRSNEGEDEPSLGSIESRWFEHLLWSGGYQRRPDHDECEVVSEDEGACIESQWHDAESDEATLGLLDRMMDQEHWSAGGAWGQADLELEDEHGGDILDQPEAVHA